MLLDYYEAADTTPNEILALWGRLSPESNLSARDDAPSCDSSEHPWEISEHARPKMRVNRTNACGSAFASERVGMNSETRFQFWSVASVARTVLVIAVLALLIVVTGAMLKSWTASPGPDRVPAENNERAHRPGIPDTYHRWDARV